MVDLTHLLANFGLVLTRVSAFIATLPILESEIAPTRARVMLAVLLTFALSGMTAGVAADGSVLSFLGEAVIGGALGLCVRVAVSTAELAGELLSGVAGLNFASVVDPLNHHEVSALTHLIVTTFGLILFASGVHLQLFLGLAESLRALPPGTITAATLMRVPLIQTACDMFAAALRLALPMGGLILGLHLSFALLARIAPQLNLWSLGFLVSSLGMLLCLHAFVPELVHQSQTIWNEAAAIIGGRF